jgi:hypothetical protein
MKVVKFNYNFFYLNEIYISTYSSTISLLRNINMRSVLSIVRSLTATTTILIVGALTAASAFAGPVNVNSSINTKVNVGATTKITGPQTSLTGGSIDRGIQTNNTVKVNANQSQIGSGVNTSSNLIPMSQATRPRPLVVVLMQQAVRL